MKKIIHRIISVALAVLLVLAMGTAAFASGEPSGDRPDLPQEPPMDQPAAIPDNAAPTGEMGPSSAEAVPPADDRQPSAEPSAEPSGEPSDGPSGEPSADPSGEPSPEPSGEPNAEPDGEPGDAPERGPEGMPDPGDMNGLWQKILDFFRSLEGVLRK